MNTFLHVVIWFVGGGVMLTAIVLACALPIAWFDHGENSRFGRRQLIWMWIADLIFIAVVVSAAIDGGLFHSNNAAHCGAGTRYVADTQYTDWQCVVG